MKFVEEFEERVKNTIKEYNLINKKDKAVVACSGGKDSTTTLYLLNKFGYNVKALIIDLLIGEWSKKNLNNVKKFCKEHKIKLYIVNMRKEFGYSICYIRSGIQKKVKLNNCAICGVIKRWILNKKARELGATKLVTGHNLNDEAETFLMNFFKGNPKLNFVLGPKNGIINNKRFVRRIKPLYFCTNEEVKKYSKKMNLPIIYDPCPCSKGAFRSNVRKFIFELKKQNPKIKENIVENSLKIREIFRKNYIANEKLRYCEICNEPSRNNICKRCELLHILRS